jgi:hypothetical protein
VTTYYANCWWVVSRCFVLALLAVVILGCGPGGPPRAPVSGTVTLDGKPLPRGTVQFVPDASRGTNGPTGVGSIDAQGRYEIQTTGAPGAILGFHVVGVVACEEVDLNKTSYAPSLIPERYNNPLASGLTAEVKKGQRNVINLELRSKP